MLLFFYEHPHYYPKNVIEEGNHKRYEQSKNILNEVTKLTLLILVLTYSVLEYIIKMYLQDGGTQNNSKANSQN